MTEQNHKNNKTVKSVVILFLALVLNISLAFSLFAGAKFFNNESKENGKEIVELAKEESIFIFQKYLLPLAFRNDGEQMRENDPQIIAYQNLYDVDKYSLSLSFDIPDKSMTANC